MGCGSSTGDGINSYIKHPSSNEIGSLLDTNGNDLSGAEMGSSFGTSNDQKNPAKSARANTSNSGSGCGREINPRPIASRSPGLHSFNIRGSLKLYSHQNSDEEKEELKDVQSWDSERRIDPVEDSMISNSFSSPSVQLYASTGPGRSGFTNAYKQSAKINLTPSLERENVTKTLSPKPTMFTKNGSLSSIDSEANSNKNQAYIKTEDNNWNARSIKIKYSDAECDAEDEETSRNEAVLFVPRVITHLAPSHRKVYYRDNFWWTDKKQVMPNYLRVAEIDSHALQVRQRLEPSALVTELTMMCENEVEKVRVIFRWIAANIAYMKMDSYDTASQTSLCVYKQRFGNCLGFSNLLKYLLGLCDIGCEVIEGIAKGASYIPGTDIDVLLDPEAPVRHCWNRVEIDGCWFLCDITWAREHDINTDGSPELKPSRFKEIWFLTDPQIFIKNHLPLIYDEYDEQFIPDLDEQQLYKTCGSVQEWDSCAWITASAMEWAVKPISHHQSIIRTEDKDLEISFESANTMTYTYSLTSIIEGKSYLGYTILYCTDSAVVRGLVRLPKKGTYLLRIQATPRLEPDIITPDKDDSDVILIYRVEAAGSKENFPYFIGRNPAWGMTTDFLETGCSIIDYTGAIFDTDTGSVSISIKLPTIDLFPHMINYTSVTNPDRNLENMLYAERNGRLMKFNLICPKVGDYLLSFWLKNRPDTEHLDVSLNLLIRSTVDASEEDYYPAHHCLWGPQEPIISLGIVPVLPLSSTVVAHDGCCVITIKLTQHINVSHRLIKMNGTNRDNWKRCVYAEQDRERLSYYFHLPERGRYKFKIAGGAYDEPSHHVALVYMLENLGEPYKGYLFPEHDNFPWGLRNEFSEQGFGCTQFLSTIPVTKQQAELQIQVPDLRVAFRPVLTHGDRPLENLEEYCVVIRNKTLNDLSILVRLPSPGYYALRIFEAKQGTPLANFLLHSEKVEEEVYGFEPLSGFYGATEAFLERGLQLISDVKSLITTDRNGKGEIVLKVPPIVDMLLIAKRKGQEVKGHILPLRDKDRVTVYFHGKEPGFYKLRGYVRGSRKQADILFVFLVHVINQSSTWEPFPDCNNVWGLNKEARSLGIQVKFRTGISESLINNTTGIASITFEHTEDYKLTGWLKSPQIPPEETKMRVFTENQHGSTVIRTSLPSSGYFTLKVGAARIGAAKYKNIGSFIIHSKTSQGKSVGFPAFNNFFVGCKLGSPFLNPLPPLSSQDFKINIPGADRVRLWAESGGWKVDLERADEDLFFGRVNVGGEKNLWITARLCKESPWSEEGTYRNVLMYEVS